MPTKFSFTLSLCQKTTGVLSLMRGFCFIDPTFITDITETEKNKERLKKVQQLLFMEQLILKINYNDKRTGYQETENLLETFVGNGAKYSGL